MNKGAKAIIALALSLILYLGIYHIYRPQINDVAGATFSKINRMVTNTSGLDNNNNTNNAPNSHDNDNNNEKNKKNIDWNNPPKPAYLQDGYMKLPDPLPSSKYMYNKWTWHKHDLVKMDALTSTVKVISYGYWATGKNSNASYGSIPKNAKICMRQGKAVDYDGGPMSDVNANITYVGFDGNTIVNN